jgi:YidC/Oxa1 family membrane protein insertase
MDRSSLVRVIGIALLFFVAYKYFGPSVGLGQKTEPTQNIPAETYVNAPGFAPDLIDPLPAGQQTAVAPPEGTLCKIKGNRFDAELSTRGAAITHFFLTDRQYAGADTGPDGLDLSTTDHERWRSLRTLFRGIPGVTSVPLDQVKYDRFDWKLDASDGSSCHFSYANDSVRIEKVVATDGRPFELKVDTTITNLSSEPRTHELAIGAFAYRRNKEIKSHLGRVSPFLTELECARSDNLADQSGWEKLLVSLSIRGGDDVTRKSKDSFKAGWFSMPLVDHYAAVSNYYFAQALVPVSAPTAKPSCDILAEDWFTYGQKRDDEDAGDVYHARLVYPADTLQPQQSATYEQIAFFGPKERNVLAKAAGGTPHLGDLINLGFFSPVARVLVGILVFFHAHVTFGNWGLAIIAMTVCLRLVMLPLSMKPVKTSIAMRKLKPEIDAIGKKYKDDAQAKNMATMELYRKHGVNPLGGCLPQVIQMPIWFAMYTTLQTAVEMYHEKFLWFTDLSAPDRFYILPLVLGAFMILQQKIVPQQGMDAMQAKMMMYLMPGVFTVMMLFLPAALGIYMLTNSILGIGQQLVIERLAPRGGPGNGAITVKQVGGKDKDDGDGPVSGQFGKGRARV